MGFLAFTGGIMAKRLLHTLLIGVALLNVIPSNEAFWFPWWGDEDSGESISGRSGWSSWLDLEDSSEEGDSSVDLEDLVLTISLEGPPKTAKPTTLATTTTDSPTTTKPKQKPKG